MDNHDLLIGMILWNTVVNIDGVLAIQSLISMVFQRYNRWYWWCSSDTMVDIDGIPEIQWYWYSSDTMVDIDGVPAIQSLISMVFQRYNRWCWWYSSDTIVDVDGIPAIQWYWSCSTDTMVDIDGIPADVDGIPVIQWLISIIFQRYNGCYWCYHRWPGPPLLAQGRLRKKVIVEILNNVGHHY